MKRKALAEKSVIIPPNTTITVPAMCAPLAKGCNYMFEASFAGTCDTIMEHANCHHQFLGQAEEGSHQDQIRDVRGRWVLLIQGIGGEAIAFAQNRAPG